MPGVPRNGRMKDSIRKSAAVLTIYDAGKMTSRGKHEVSEWLREHANDLEIEGNSYSPLFRGRFQYRK
jgi:hypothetical protein